jgi:hypothetical protein
MRKSWLVVVLALGLLIGYAVLRARPAAAQGEFQPFAVGETVRLTVENFPGGMTTITCKVASVNNDFIHCSSDAQRRPRAVNLRYVQEIQPVAER